MRIQRFAALVGVLAVGVVASTGCVGKKAFRTNVEQVDSRIGSVESAVEANQKRVDDLRKETDRKLADASSKADQASQLGNDAMRAARDASAAADRAMKGKLLWSVKLSNEQVKFGFNQEDLPSEAKAVLDELIQQVKSYGKAVYLEIEGHTDSTGSEEYNFMLGQERANAVRDYLRSAGGIPLHAMSTISYGESNPEADNNSRDGRARNRRVVVHVLE